MSQGQKKKTEEKDRGELLAAVASDEEDFNAAVLPAVGNGVELTQSRQDFIARVKAEFAKRRGRVKTDLYWSYYIGWFFSGPIRWSSWIMAGVAIVAIIGIIPIMNLFHEPRLLFVAGGLLGAVVIVLLKLPGPSVYGNIAPFACRAAGRLLAGVTAALVGLGLLTSGVFSLSLGSSRSFAELVNTFSKNGTTPAEGALLVSAAVLLGFSERALTALDSSIFGRKTPGATPRKDATIGS